MTEKEFNSQLRKIKARNNDRKYIKRLRDERKKGVSLINLPPASKLMAVYLFLMLNIIVIFAMVAMWHFADISYIAVLLESVAGQILVYFIYSLKSTKENCAGGIVYDKTMRELDLSNKQNAEPETELESEAEG